MEGGGQAEVVGGEGARHHVEVAAHGGVHADADAGVGDHHVGQALLRDAGGAGRDDAVDLGDVGAVDPPAAGVQLPRRRPGLDLGRAPRHQRQVVAGRRRSASASAWPMPLEAPVMNSRGLGRRPWTQRFGAGATAAAA